MADQISSTWIVARYGLGAADLFPQKIPVSRKALLKMQGFSHFGTWIHTNLSGNQHFDAATLKFLGITVGNSIIGDERLDHFQRGQPRE